jgi:hypothetical protein
MIFKNTAGQGVYLFAYDTGANVPKTGDAANITGKATRDGGASASTATANPTEIGGGVYWQPLAQAETNANTLALYWSSATSGVQIDPFIVMTDSGGVTVGTRPSPAPAGYGPGGGAGTTAVTDLAGGSSRSPSIMTVQNNVGAPIQGATVTAYLASAYASNPGTASVLSSTTTDANGHWTLNITTGAGALTLVFAYPGDQTATGSVTV